MSGEVINTFDDDDTQRIIDVVRFVENRVNIPRNKRPQPVSEDYSGVIFLTPSGGIPARTGSSSPWTPGAATCTECEVYWDSGTLKIRTTSRTETIYNMVTSTVGNGGRLIQTKLIGYRRFADVEAC